MKYINYYKKANTVNICPIPFFKVINFYKRVPKKFEKYAALITFITVVKQVFKKKTKIIEEGKCYGKIGKIYYRTYFSIFSKKYGFIILVKRYSLLKFKILEYFEPLPNKEYNFDKQIFNWAKDIFKKTNSKMSSKYLYFIEDKISFYRDEDSTRCLIQGNGHIEIPPAYLQFIV